MSVAPAALPRAVARTSRWLVCVDLDGTLVVDDLLWESFVRLVKQHPLRALALAGRASRGKAYLKQRIAAEVPIDPAALSYREALVAHLRDLERDGAELVLATGSDRAWAQAVADHLGLFSDVLASDGRTNLSGRRKARALEERYGPGGFDYIGNDRVDLHVWRLSDRATAVAVPPRVARRLRSEHRRVEVHGTRCSPFAAFVRAMRPHQWVKNLLVFVPFLAAHHFLRWDLWRASALTAAALSLCASAIYVLNDICDIQSDRAHPRKRRRPFACGDLSIPAGLTAAGVLLAAAGAIAALGAGWKVASIVGVYAAAASLYSLRLKQEPVADVFMLTGLYVLRIVAGGIATGTPLSSWLLAFALFFFLSLAFVKRYTEVIATNGRMPGRGYGPQDSLWMHSVGTSAGYMAVVVLALYVTGSDVAMLYSRPKWLALLCPVLLFWISRLWLRVGRGMVRDDPVAEALHDPASYVLAAAVLLITLVAV